jgi:hypothetical protein
MSDMGLGVPDPEAPDADAAEQHNDVFPDDDTNDELPDLADPPLEASEADAVEQGEVVSIDEDEYR